MATAWSDCITSSLVFIDDERMTEDLAINPALFYRRMSEWVKMGIALMSRPPELLIALQNELIEPAYADYTWESTNESMTQETVLDTGCTDYELCSVVSVEVLPNGEVIHTPYNGYTYNPETGEVTFEAQEAAGISYQLDFYNDGQFAVDLTLTQKRLLALAIATTWDNRFNRDWLSMAMKIHDKSFNTVNENTFMKESTARFLRNAEVFFSELRKYEQDCNYMRLINPTQRVGFLL